MSERYKLKLKDEKLKEYKVKVTVDYEIEVKGFDKEQALREAKLIFNIGEKDPRVKEISFNWKEPEEVKKGTKFYYKKSKGLIYVFDEDMNLKLKCSKPEEVKELGFSLDDPRFVELEDV